MKHAKDDEHVIKLIVKAYPEKPTNEELQIIGQPRARVFVRNPQVDDYNEWFAEDNPASKITPRGYSPERSDVRVVISFFVVAAIVFLLIAWLLGTLL